MQDIGNLYKCCKYKEQRSIVQSFKEKNGQISHKDDWKPTKNDAIFFYSHLNKVLVTDRFHEWDAIFFYNRLNKVLVTDRTILIFTNGMIFLLHERHKNTASYVLMHEECTLVQPYHEL